MRSSKAYGHSIFLALMAAVFIAGATGFYSSSVIFSNNYPSFGTLTRESNGTSASPAKSRPCQKTKNETQSDLCAQWRAAAAAERSALWTLFGLIVGLLGSGLLIWQIKMTRDAIEGNTQALAVMREANRLAQLDQRPWVQVGVAVRHTVARETDVEIGLRVTLKNTGRDVARNVSIRKDCENLSNETTNAKALSLFKQEGSRGEFHYVIQPGDSHEIDINVGLPKELGPLGFVPVIMIHCTYEWSGGFAQNSCCYAAIVKGLWVGRSPLGKTPECHLKKIVPIIVN